MIVAHRELGQDDRMITWNPYDGVSPYPLSDLSGRKEINWGSVTTDILGLVMSGIIITTTDQPVFRFVAGAGGIWFFLSLVSDLGPEVPKPTATKKNAEETDARA